jgi:Protein of unknown function (DUF2829)
MESQIGTFGWALERLKEDALVMRKGWNGKGMFIFRRPEDNLPVGMIINTVKSLPQSVKLYFEKSLNKLSEENPEAEKWSDIKVKFTSYLCMKAADGTIVNGWLASQTDMLSDDWEEFTF